MDETDRKIIALLRDDARMPVSEIARRVDLSAAPVARRIERMEREGVIRGYVAIVDERAVGELDAFTELRLTGSTATQEIEAIVRGIPEVQQFYAISGDPDALVRFRVGNLAHLQDVINMIRRTGLVSQTKTLMVMSAWDRSQEGRPDAGPTPPARPQ